MVAFALGGAGSRGDFQVGALRFLHDKGVMPSFISGTSGGALLAAKLAEGGNAIDELEAIWHGLSNENDLFEEEPWLAQLEFVLRRVAWEISGFSVGGVLRAALFPSTIYFDGIRLAAEGTLDVSILIGAVRQALDAKGALNLRPLERMLRGVRHGMEADLDASGLEYAAKFAVVGDFDGDGHDEIAIAPDTPGSPGNDFWVLKYGAGSWYHLSPIPGHGMEADLDASGLEYAAKFAVVGDFDGDTHDEIAIAPDTPGSPGNDFWVLKYGAGSWYHLSPIYGQLGVLNPRKVAQSGIQLRLAVVDLESGQLRFVTELGRFLDDDGTAFDLIDGVLASGSMSGVFPPVQLGQDNYTDGGIRDLVPIRVALDAGVDHVFAIYPSPGVIRVNGSFDGRRSELPYLADLGSRCIDIMLDQNRRDEMSPGGVIGQLITSIQSSVEVHDGTTIDPGLISISMDYGYMRAFDVLEGGEQREELVGLSDEITQRRRDVWETEYWANGIERLARPHARGVEQLVLVPSPDALLDVRQQKRVIFDLVQRRIQLKGAGAMPVGMERWWRQWERHPWDTYTDTPWQAFDSSAGHVDAANPPG